MKKSVKDRNGAVILPCGRFSDNNLDYWVTVQNPTHEFYSWVRLMVDATYNGHLIRLKFQLGYCRTLIGEDFFACKVTIPLSEFQNRFRYLHNRLEEKLGKKVADKEVDYAVYVASDITPTLVVEPPTYKQYHSTGTNVRVK